MVPRVRVGGHGGGAGLNRIIVKSTDVKVQIRSCWMKVGMVGISQNGSF